MKKVMLDIDGVMNNYPQTFIDYVNNKLNTNYDTLEQIQSSIDFADFRRLKDKYKFSAYKHDAKVKDGLLDLIKYFKDNDYLIYIITSRDLFVRNQLELTITWLRKNGISYDFIYRSENKAMTIREKFGYFNVVVDDNLVNCIEIRDIDCGAKIFCVTSMCNSDTIRGITCVEKLDEIIKNLEGEI